MVILLDDDYRKTFLLDQLFIKNNKGIPIPFFLKSGQARRNRGTYMMYI